MIKILHILFFIFIAIGVCYAQKTDWEEMGLKGKVKTITKTEFKAADSNGVVKKLYAGSLITDTFNEVGFKTTMIRFDEHTKEIDETSRYIYDKNGLLIRDIWGGDNGIITSKSIYKTDKQGNWIEKTAYENKVPVSVTVRDIECYE